eukprot:1139457-Pelagomonas_calceolata.AAC.2
MVSLRGASANKSEIRHPHLKIVGTGAPPDRVSANFHWFPCVFCCKSALFQPKATSLWDSVHILDFNQVHMLLVYIQSVRLSHAVGCRGPLCEVVSAA